MECADYMGLQGSSLSIGEKTALSCSLPVLSRQVGKKVTLWGKVLGVQGSDYLIAQYAGEDFLDQAVSFYSVDGGTHWTQLTDPTEQQIEFSAQIRGPFIGDPNYEYKLQKDLPPEEPAAVDPEAEAIEAAALEEKPEDEEPADEDGEEDAEEAEPEAGEEEEEEKKPVKRRPKFQILTMKESVRLTYFIQEHDRACKLVPRGAVLRSNDNIITNNRAFKGLSVEEGTQLRNYFKRREHLDAKANAALFGDNFAETRDFLHSIADDVPNGIWALKYDDMTGTAVLHNLLFLGSIFYHKADTATYGQVYVGTGERNLDLLFMLP